MSTQKNRVQVTFIEDEDWERFEEYRRKTRQTKAAAAYSLIMQALDMAGLSIRPGEKVFTGVSRERRLEYGITDEDMDTLIEELGKRREGEEGDAL